MNREQQILDFIKDFHTKNQWAPSVREIAVGVGLYSTSTVHGYLVRLAKKGRITYNGVRQIRLKQVEAKDQVLQLAREALKETIQLYALGMTTIRTTGDRRKRGTVDESKRERAREIEWKACKAIQEIDKALGGKDETNEGQED